MITYIKADGFRSLSKQIIKINTGLNVLVGPNGAGKTNVLTALDFIGHLLEHGPISAINKSGGVGGVFQRQTDPHNDGFGLANNINFSVGGVFGITNSDSNIIKHKRLTYVFQYNFKLSLDKTKQPILKKQSFDLYVTHIDGKSLDTPMAALSIKEGARGKFSIPNVSKDLLLDTTFTNIKSNEGLKKSIQVLLEQRNWPSKCLLNKLSNDIYLSWIVKTDIQHSERLTITPDKLRYGDDFTASPKVSHDGSGTIRTLHALKTNTLKGMSKKQCQEIYKEILKELSLAVDNICDLDIYEDISSTKYMLSLVIKDKNGNLVKIPSKFASEGTLKWLVLITFIKTGSVFSLEEPENFLHPWMQIELVRLLREYRSTNPSHPVLLTTHSETLINELKVNEIIVTWMEDGITKITRPKNKKDLEKEIHNTGFKLGYYYVAGAIDYE